MPFFNEGLWLEKELFKFTTPEFSGECCSVPAPLSQSFPSIFLGRERIDADLPNAALFTHVEATPGVRGCLEAAAAPAAGEGAEPGNGLFYLRAGVVDSPDARKGFGHFPGVTQRSQLIECLLLNILLGGLDQVIGK